jgi:uncharacterized membrane protein YqhA
MRTVFGYMRYLILIGVLGLLVCTVAVFVYAGIFTGVTLVETFRHGAFDAQGARTFSAELIELIDLYLLGTVLLITAVGLHQLFIDPHIPLPEWLAVSNLEQLKANLVAVIIVMLAVLFLGEAASGLNGSSTLLEYGAGVALVIAAVAVAVYIFQRVHLAMEAHKYAVTRQVQHAQPETAVTHEAGHPPSQRSS